MLRYWLLKIFQCGPNFFCSTPYSGHSLGYKKISVTWHTCPVFFIHFVLSCLSTLCIFFLVCIFFFLELSVKTQTVGSLFCSLIHNRCFKCDPTVFESDAGLVAEGTLIWQSEWRPPVLPLRSWGVTPPVWETSSDCLMFASTPDSLIIKAHSC